MGSGISKTMKGNSKTMKGNSNLANKFSPWNLIMRTYNESDKKTILDDINVCDRLTRPTWMEVHTSIRTNLLFVLGIPFDSRK